jgi:hypothetical protein
VAACPMVPAADRLDDAVTDPDVPRPTTKESTMRRHPYASAMLARAGSETLAPLLAPSGSHDIAQAPETSSAPGR